MGPSAEIPSGIRTNPGHAWEGTDRGQGRILHSSPDGGCLNALYQGLGWGVSWEMGGAEAGDFKDGTFGKTFPDDQSSADGRGRLAASSAWWPGMTPLSLC